jgi:hypothetical protein
MIEKRAIAQSHLPGSPARTWGHEISMAATNDQPMLGRTFLFKSMGHDSGSGARLFVDNFFTNCLLPPVRPAIPWQALDGMPADARTSLGYIRNRDRLSRFPLMY